MNIDIDVNLNINMNININIDIKSLQGCFFFFLAELLANTLTVEWEARCSNSTGLAG